uniref:Uncharacterized protein n=1 Tax=Trichobilharzia regenti TaxID=157069 RepID=A0AA85J192_TRIRE|nr:unnamed protein product [Trichobilharzia regenti]
MLKFIENNPNLCDTVAGSLNTPIGTKLSNLQEDLLWEVALVEPSVLAAGKIKPSSKENPNLVSSSDIRTIQQCHCDPHHHYTMHLLLHRDLPTRCQCGHWFLLVDEKTYEEEREKKWAKIKDEPENVELLKRFEELEKEMNILLAEGKSMSLNTPGSDELMDNIAIKWKEMKKIYAKMRKNMLLD